MNLFWAVMLTLAAWACIGTGVWAAFQYINRKEAEAVERILLRGASSPPTKENQ